MFAVDVGFLHLRELGVILQRTELVNLLIRPRRLSRELVARDIQNLKSLIMILPVKLLQFPVLRGESASGRRIHNQKYLSLISGQRLRCPVRPLHRIIINAHLLPSFLFVIKNESF